MTDRYENIRKALAMGPTPGPRGVRYDYVVEAHAYEDGRLVPVAQPYGVNCDGTDIFANARLIAACDPETISDLLAENERLKAQCVDLEQFRCLADFVLDRSANTGSLNAAHAMLDLIDAHKGE